MPDPVPRTAAPTSAARAPKSAISSIESADSTTGMNEYRGVGAFERVTSSGTPRSPRRTGSTNGPGAPGVVPWWAIASATLAPLALVGGWLVAGAQQRGNYSAVRQSISVLAGDGADDRWIMTTCLFVVGCCHLVTASGLRQLRPLARWALALGGLLDIGVALFPQPVDGATPAHLACAIAGAVVMTSWPALASSRSWPWPSPLSPPVATAVTLLFLALCGWMALESLGGSGFGLAERVTTTADTLWPLVVVTALTRPPGEPGEQSTTA